MHIKKRNYKRNNRSGLTGGNCQVYRAISKRYEMKTISTRFSRLCAVFPVVYSICNHTRVLVCRRDKNVVICPIKLARQNERQIRVSHACV